MNSLKKQFLNLGLGELAAVYVFIFVYRLFNLGTASFIAVSYLIFILIQGSFYWFYRYILIIKKERFSLKVIKLLRLLRRLNLLLLVVIVITIPIIQSSNKDLISAIGLFLFGIIEYVNYYWYRLSYGKSGFNIKILFNRGLKKSSINRILYK